MIEKNIQSSYLMDFLCRRQDGLGYREVKCTTVNNDLFIPADLLEFLKTNSRRQWNNVVKKNDGDEKLALDLLMEEIKARLKDATNVAVFLNRNKSITFQGESLQLIYVSGSELRGDEDFKKNIFSASEEVSYTFKLDDRKIFSIRPDVSFFVNGIFLGYLELKSPFNGQSAAKDGRAKILTDYMEAVQEYAALAGLNDESQALRREMLRIFENSIHLVTTDINETYVLRNVGMFCDELRKGFADHSISMTDKKAEMEKTFKIYPVRNPDAPEKERFEEVMRALYSKQMIEKEILYYNFLQYEIEKRGKKKERKSNRGRLISPRPKQKFGCDKIMDRIQEFLEHEKEPNYFLNKLRSDLLAQGVSLEKAEEIVAKRDAYCNNKYVYSLLLQYAAGFGKSNIIGWTALQLKDLRHEGKWVYDKILIVVDRLQLRDQLDTMMMSMNIDKAMFTEAKDTPSFIKALQDKKRIIVVNIQKFDDMKSAIEKAGVTLKTMRVAFLIDEIHRSNTGVSHEEMMSIFDQLQDTFDESEGTLLSGKGKKNLIVGFTATPSAKVLARFGELKKSTNIDPIWVPFDSYSMKEAIRDGYILDPTKHIIAVPAKMYFELPDGILRAIEAGTDAQKYGLKKDHVYENRDRMKAISSFIVNRLLNLVYTKIHGTGKAMLAVTSIPIAIEYCRIIRQMMKEKTKQARYARFADAPVSIVYSDNQDYPASKTMNDGVPEEKVIANFKAAKNGIIIVVDKLQTGFDEPKLHTLFLDKEIHDINAIQTISRVDRVCKYKEECHIVDFSFNNENIHNIQQAFLDYSDIVVSDFNAQAELAVIEDSFRQLCLHDLYVKWFKLYTDSKKDPEQNVHVTMEMVQDFRLWIRDAIQRYQQFMQSHPNVSQQTGPSGSDIAASTEPGGADDAKKLRLMIGGYTSRLNLLDGVLEFKPAYKSEDILDFWRRYCEIYQDETAKENSSNAIIVEYDGSIGLTVDPELEEPQKDNAEENEDEEGPDGKKKKGGKKGPGGTDILAMIKRLNEEAEAKAEEVEFWYGIIQTFFNFLKEDGSFVAMITDEGNRFDRAEIQREYAALTRKFKRQHGSDHELLVKFINENTEYLFDAFIEYLDNPEAWSQTIEFDDTPEDQEPELFAAHGIPQARKAGKSMSGKAGSGYMKALSIKQPWASLIIKGLKDVENRTWQVTDLPATVLIHTGVSMDNAAVDFLENDLSDMGFKTINGILMGNVPEFKEMPRSAIIGYATIVDCAQNYPSDWASPGQNHWVIKDAYEFDQPITGVRGQLGLYNYPIDPDNLPPAHKAEPKMPRIEGKTIHMPLSADAYKAFDTGKDFAMDAADDIIEILCPDPTKPVAAPLDTIVIESIAGTKTFELTGIQIQAETDPETHAPVTYPAYDGSSQTYYRIIFHIGDQI